VVDDETTSPVFSSSSLLCCNLDISCFMTDDTLSSSESCVVVTVDLLGSFILFDCAVSCKDEMWMIMVNILASGIWEHL